MSGDEKRWQIELTDAQRASSDATIPDSRVQRISVEGEQAQRARLGPYAIQREIGRGGQGVVYLAEDTRLGRQVALKVLSNVFGADAWSRLRFEREATATARLDHPGICTVYEAGTIDQTPFIAMRLVTGEPLSHRTKATKAEQPRKTASTLTGTRQRRDALFAEVEIVEKVARALHAAHEAGLVHRDIKPGNVMVEPSGQPVVLDFGLARDAQNTDLLLTGTGAFLGTPPYMSPEQVDGTGTIDRRTDIWSLGVMLYEVATGTRPFEAPTIEGLMRAIRTVDPTDPRRLNPTVTPELSAVILTALGKDKGHRYQDALALADDLGRARRLEPVLARAPSTLMRLKRWAQRNPAVAASLAVVLLTLSVALVVSLGALGTAKEALERETSALNEARDQRNRAEDLLSFMLVDMKAQLEILGRLDLLGKVARKAGDYFATRPLDLDKAKESLQRALSLRNVGDVLKAEGDVMAAVARYEEACRIEEALWKRDPMNAAPLMDLVGSVHALAVAAMVRGDRAEAVAKAERSLDLRRKLVELMPGDCDAHALLIAGMITHANALKFADRPAEAIPIYKEGIDRWEGVCEADSRPVRRRELAMALQNFGEARRATGNLAGAIDSRLRGLEVFESLARDEPEAREWQEQVAATHHGIAIALGGRKDHPGAIEHSTQAVAIFRRLQAEDPINTRRLFQLGTAVHALANAYTDSQQTARALEALQESASARARLVALDSKNRSWRSDLADTKRAIGVAVASLGRTEEAIEHFDGAVVLFRALANERPDDFHGQGMLAKAMDRAALILWELGRPTEALVRYLGAVDAATVECSVPNPSARALRDLALRIENAADTARVAGVRDRSRELVARAIERRRDVLLRCVEAERGEAMLMLAKDLASLGQWQLDDGSPANVSAFLDEAISLLEHPSVQGTEKTRADHLLVHAHLALADTHAATSRLDAAEASADRAESAFEAIPENARASSTQAKVRAHLELMRRLRRVLAEGRSEEASDHEALARHFLATGRAAEAVLEFVPALGSSEIPDALRLPTLESAIFAASRALGAAAPDTRARTEALALGWIAERVGLLRDQERSLDSRIRAQAARGHVANSVRDQIGEIRCQLAAIRADDPALAEFRKLPGFEAAARGAR